MQWSDATLVASIRIGTCADELTDDQSLSGWIPCWYARPTVDGIVKWFSPAPIPRTHVCAPVEQFIHDGVSKSCRRHMEAGIAVVDVMANPIEEISLGVLPRRA